MTAIVRQDGRAGRAAAIDVLRAGGVIALPTDTVYGICVALSTPGGVDRLFAVKDRPPDKAISVLADDLSQVEDSVAVPDEARRLAAAFWPGGLTLVLPLEGRAVMPAALTAGTAALGVRVPAHACPRALARELGALPTTSANLSGAPDPVTAADVAATIGDRIDLILDGGPSPGGVASTVVDCTVMPVRILRVGAVSPADIARALGSSVAWEDSDVGRASRRTR
jgi:L-threonylcarbamoyladenylate synthase